MLRKATTGLAAAVLSLVSITAVAEAPRLVLQITVDGLRADLPQRYRHNYVRGGLGYLMDKGMVFGNTHYQHANTETIVGHTTLATGATPAVHGMIGNVWYHADSGELGYNIEDPEAPLLPTREVASSGAQVDPAQNRSRSKGRSPRGILVPTFSDTLKIATGGRGKNFGISGKDRSAVAMAGHTGTAYWYSTDSGDFQSSTYYMEGYPAWVGDWNSQRRAAAYGGTDWSLVLDADDYLHKDQDDRAYEIDLKGYGKTFPHNFGPADHPLFYTRLLVSPIGDELLADFGKRLMVEERLGQDEVTDYLSISFSGVDAVNHFFGPGSLENEDVVLRLDRTIADLLAFVDDEVGLEHTLIVLSADHGMAEMPEYATSLGHSAKRLYSHEVLEVARAQAEKHFGSPELVKDFFRPYLYLDAEALARKGLDRATVAAVLASSLEAVPGIAGAVTAQQAESGSGAATGAIAAVRANHHPQRAGDIYLFQQPYWYLFDRGPIGVMHGSPWKYDTHVPLIFVGRDIEAGHVSRLVHPVDVAPTLSALLNINPPAGAQGNVLPEVISR